MNSKKTFQVDQQFFAEIRDLLHAGRETAYRSVNTVMVQTYWQIGKRIVEEEQNGKARAGYGDYLIVNLSRYLTDCFGKGFSVANLWNFKQFYLTFSDFEQFSTQCVGNLAWTHIRLIMRLDDEKERHYYLQEASAQNWSSRLLERNIKSGYYRRLLSSQNKKSELHPINPQEIARKKLSSSRGTVELESWFFEKRIRTYFIRRISTMNLKSCLRRWPNTQDKRW